MRHQAFEFPARSNAAMQRERTRDRPDQPRPSLQRVFPDLGSCAPWGRPLRAAQTDPQTLENARWKECAREWASARKYRCNAPECESIRRRRCPLPRRSSPPRWPLLRRPWSHPECAKDPRDCSFVHTAGCPFLHAIKNSGTLVFPRMMAPAARSLFTSGASSEGTFPFRKILPHSQGSPATSIELFIEIGTP